MIRFNRKKYEDLYYDSEAEKIRTMRANPETTNAVRRLKSATNQSGLGKWDKFKYSPVGNKLLGTSSKLSKKRKELEKRGIENPTFYEMTGKETPENQTRIWLGQEPKE